MATVKLNHATAASYTISSLNSLASGSVAVGNAFDVSGATNPPLDVLFEVLIDPGTTTGNKQAILYVVTSLDGTNFSDTTNRENMIFLGTVTLPDTNVVRSRSFSVAAACGGTLPDQFKVAVYNDSGASFNTTGNSAQIQEVTASVA